MSVHPLHTHRLRNGTEVRLVCVQAPEPDYAAALGSFFRHKGSPWVDDIVAVVDGRHGESLGETFVLAEQEGVPVASVWTSMRPDKPQHGCLGHVYTHPSMRRQGLATELMRVAVDDFARRGGVWLLLGTGSPDAERLYERFGFRSIWGDTTSGGGCVMMRDEHCLSGRAIVPARVVPKGVRPAARSDLAELIAMSLRPPVEPPRGDWALDLHLPASAEDRFVKAFWGALNDECRLFVMESEYLLAGVASLVLKGDRAWAVGYYVHPDCPEAGGRLLRESIAQAGLVGCQLVSEAACELQASSLAEAGFSLACPSLGDTWWEREL